MLRATMGLLRRLEPANRRRWYVLLPLALLATALEAACTLGVVVLLGQLSGARPQLPLWASALAPSTPALCLAGIALYLARGLTRVAETRARHAAASHGTRDLGRKLLALYLAAPQTWHLARHHMDLHHRLLALVRDACHRQLYSLMGAVIEGLTVAGLLACVWWSSPATMLVASAALALVVAITLRLSQRRLARLGSETQRLDAQANKRLAELLHSMKEIRLSGIGGAAAEAMDAVWGERARREIETGVLAGVPRITLETLFIVAVLAVEVREADVHEGRTLAVP